MTILVTAATELEIKSFINSNKSVDILITGVGVPATLYRLHKKLLEVKYDMVIQAGIAGTFNNNVNLGETVIVKQDTFGDIGVEEKKEFKTLFDTGLNNPNEFPFENGWLLNNHAILNHLPFMAVKAITVNKITDNAQQNQQMGNYFGASIESMEGAALHYICLQEKIPFIQVRSISNYIGERDKAKWKMDEALANLNHQLSELIDFISLTGTAENRS